MWWLDNGRFDNEHNARGAFLRHRATRLGSAPTRPVKRVSTLTEAENEANKCLLEAAVLDETFSCCPHQVATAETNDQRRPRREAGRSKLQEWKQQLADLHRLVSEQARERERGRIHEQWLRRELIESEQRLSSREEQITALRLELDEQTVQAAQRIADLQRKHEAESAYLTATANDADRRADRLNTKLQRLQLATQQQAASHQAQLQQLQRKFELDVQTADEQVAVARKRSGKLEAERMQMQGQLQIAESIRRQQSRQLAQLNQQHQTAESIVGQTQRSAA